jgi:hypothetical protein
MTKCFNKNLKEYKVLLNKYKSDALVNAIIEKHQYNKGDDTYPTIEEAEEISKDKSFTNYSLINNLKKSLAIRVKTLRDELSKREISNKIYIVNKTKIDRLLRQINNSQDEQSFVYSVEFANQYLKDIKDSLEDGRFDKASLSNKARFLSDASRYVKTYDSLRYIDTTDFSEKSKKLKADFNNEIVILEKKLQEYKKETAINIVEAPLTSEEKEFTDFSDLLTNEIQDINSLEFSFGALATSTNPILASIDRTYKAESDKSRLDTEVDYKELVELDKELTKLHGSDKSFMYNISSDNKVQNKYIVSEIQPEFYEQRANLSNQFPTVDDNGDRIEYKFVAKEDNTSEANSNRLHNLSLKDNKKKKGSWYKENTEYTKEFKDELDKFTKAKYILVNTVKDPKGNSLFEEYSINPNLSQHQYEQIEYFIETQFDASTYYSIDKEGNIIDIVDPYDEEGKINNNLAAWRPKTNNFKPKDKWNDSRYKELMSGRDVKSVYYQTYRKLYEKYGNKVPEYSYKNNELIAMQRNWIDNLIDNPSLKRLGIGLFPEWKSSNISNIKRDENGNIIPIGLKLLYTGSIDTNIQDKINALETQKQKASTQEEIDSIDLKLSKLYSSVELGEINTNLTESLLNYMNMASKYELKSKLERQFSLVQDVVEDSQSFSKDYFTGKIRPTNNRIATRLQDFINTRIYDEVRADRDLISTKIADTISKVTSISGIGLAIRPALGNTITATFNNFIEGFGGQFYSTNNYLKGKKIATGNIKQLLNSLSNGEQTKVNALIDRLGLFEKFNPVNPNDVVEKLDWKRKMTSDIFFIMQNASEYYVQSSVALAMTHSHRVVDGKILTELEYKDLYKNNEFENYPTFYDSIDFIDNDIKFKNGLEVNNDKTKDEIFLFSQRIIGVNQKIHGRYTTDDANRLQQFALGRIFQQFKRWISAAVEERFTKKHYDYRLRSDIEGRYVTMYRVLSNLKKEGLKILWDWKNLNELEKSNIRKIYIELSAIMTTGILAYLAKKAGDNFDDEDEYYLRKLAHFGAYMSNRTYSELTTFYQPNVLLTASNAPVLGTIKEMGEFGNAVLMYPFRDEDTNHYSRGTNKGRLKVEKEFGDLVPIWKDISFYNSLDVQGNYYFSIK